MMPTRLYHQFFCILVKPSHYWWLCRLQRLLRAKTLSNFSSLCKVCLHCGHSSKITSVHLSSAPPPPPGTLCWGAGDQTPMTSLKLLNCWAGLNWSVRRGSKAGRQHPVVGALISLSLSFSCILAALGVRWLIVTGSHRSSKSSSTISLFGHLPSGATQESTRHGCCDCVPRQNQPGDRGEAIARHGPGWKLPAKRQRECSWRVLPVCFVSTLS